jgi:peptidoglycan/LPS O-acetylase OafA/YrhL
VGRIRAGRRVIGERLSDRHNSLNFLRLALAVMVVLSHAFVGGFNDPLLLNNTSLGTIAVYGFFGISGYLIAHSASRHSLGRYLWQRFLRIFPGFWVCLVMTGFFFAAMAWLSQPHPACPSFTSCYLGSPTGPVDYVFHNFFLRIYQPRIAGTPAGLLSSWNIPLWTLSYEFLCYLLLAGLAWLGLLRHRLVVAGLAGGLWVLEIAVAQANPVMSQDVWACLTLIPIFLTGSLLYLYREKVPDSGVLALVLGALFLASPWLPFGGRFVIFRETINAPQVLAPCAVYAVLWLGLHLPLRRVGARNDYSYGIYIYAFVLQQLLAVWNVQRWGYLAYMSLSILATVPVAVASWWIVERNALKLKRLDVRSLWPPGRATAAPPAGGAATGSATGE